MATLSQLQAFRGKLQDARYSGILLVRDSDGEMRTYKSDADMARAMAALDSEIAAAQARPASSITFTTSKGL